MSTKEKNEIISQIFMLLSKLVENDVSAADSKAVETVLSKPDTETMTAPVKQTCAVPDEAMEMLTIKECTELVKGLSSNTIRKMIARGELECVRAGCGTNGKILIPKANIMSLFSNQRQ